MADIFLQTFGSTVMSMMKILFIVLIAGVLVRKKVISQDNLTGLSAATVDVFLPSMIFTNILSRLNTGEMPFWWVLPLCAVLMTGLGLLLGAAAFAKELPSKMNMLPLACIQNSGYLVLPIGAVLYKDQFELFSVYVFLYILGQSPLIWSIGKYMATNVPGEPQSFKGLFTPPMISTLIAIVMVFSGLGRFLTAEDAHGLFQLIPIFFAALKLLGEATVPVALFVLGGILGGITIKLKPWVWDAVRVVAIKQFIIPLFTLMAVYYWDLGLTHPLLAAFLIIQSAAAPAVTIMLQLKRYGGDEEKMGSILLLCYGVCLVSLPLWMAVWNSMMA